MYSKCQLTKEADKLIAISAIARAMAPIINCRYVAGLWEKDLVKQFGWSSEVGGRRPMTYRAPSWSWASIEGHCTFKDYRTSANPLIKIRSACVDVASNDSMGSVKGGHLAVTGQLFVFDGEPHWAHHSKIPIPESSVILKFLRDCSLTEIKGPLHLLPLTIKEPRRRAHFTALVLQQRGHQACYQRVGCVIETLNLEEESNAPLLKALADFRQFTSFSKNSARLQHIRLV